MQPPARDIPEGRHRRQCNARAAAAMDLPTTASPATAAPSAPDVTNSDQDSPASSYVVVQEAPEESLSDILGPARRSTSASGGNLTVYGLMMTSQPSGSDLLGPPKGKGHSSKGTKGGPNPYVNPDPEDREGYVPLEIPTDPRPQRRFVDHIRIDPEAPQYRLTPAERAEQDASPVMTSATRQNILNYFIDSGTYGAAMESRYDPTIHPDAARRVTKSFLYGTRPMDSLDFLIRYPDYFAKRARHVGTDEKRYSRDHDCNITFDQTS